MDLQIWTDKKQQAERLLEDSLAEHEVSILFQTNKLNEKEILLNSAVEEFCTGRLPIQVSTC